MGVLAQTTWRRIVSDPLRPGPVIISTNALGCRFVTAPQSSSKCRSSPPRSFPLKVVTHVKERKSAEPRQASHAISPKRDWNSQVRRGLLLELLKHLPDDAERARAVAAMVP